MSNFICELTGSRGRSIKIYDNKCEIITDVTWGSVVSGNATDGRKTIFYIDCTGVQFKEAGTLIGYLQLETSSSQMNNQKSNFFSENTFTFGDGWDSVNNKTMLDVYKYIVDRMEGYKYNDEDILNADLPESLAGLYGKPRPKTKVELKKEKDEIEQKQEETKAKLAENIFDDRIVNFLYDLNQASSYRKIHESWKLQKLDNDPEYRHVTEELERRLATEKTYGKENPRVFNAYVQELNRLLSSKVEH